MKSCSACPGGWLSEWLFLCIVSLTPIFICSMEDEDEAFDKTHLALQLQVLEYPHRIYHFLARVIAGYDSVRSPPDIAHVRKALSSRYSEDLLLNAFADGHESIVVLLMKKVGIRPQMTPEARRHALEVASSRGHAVIVQLLLEESDGPKEETRNSGKYGTELRAASANGHRAIVELLLDHGADIDARDPETGDALQLACSNGHQDIVRLLLERGAGVHVGSGVFEHALRAASANNHDAIVRMLLDQDAVQVRGEA